MIAPDADYRGDAARILDAQSPRALGATAAHAAAYGLALDFEMTLHLTIESPDTPWPLIAPRSFPRSRTSPRGCGSIRSASTSEAGSGHPTSCCSAADIMAALFFAEMRFDPKDPQQSRERSLRAVEGARGADSLRRVGRGRRVRSRRAAEAARRSAPISKGHPTPRLPFVDVATGSLGQGICAAIGIALNARRIESDYRTYVLLGDGESAEGSVWEAANVGAMDRLDNLCGITDVNGLGQSRADDVGARHGAVRAPLDARSAGTRSSSTATTSNAILDALAEARRTKGQPTMILARTIKGKGVSFVEGKDGWHGKAFKKGEELDRALAELEKQFVPVPAGRAAANLARRSRSPRRRRGRSRRRSRSRRRPTSWASRSRRARRTAPRSPSSAMPIRASSRSTPTSRTRRSATGSRRRIPIASTRTSSPSR